MSIKAALLAAIAIAFLTVGGLALYWRGNAISAEAERDKARSDLRVAVEANRTNLDTIAKLRAEAERDNQLSAEVLAALDRIGADVAEANKTLDELGEANEDVREFLGLTVPDELRRLYDKPARGSGSN